MGKIIDVVRDRRKLKRKSVKIIFLYKIGQLFNGRGFAKDINVEGMCIVCPALFKTSRGIQLKDYIGSSLQVMIPTANVTVHGTVMWADLKKGEGGIKVTSTSDDARWRQICEEA